MSEKKYRKIYENLEIHGDIEIHGLLARMPARSPKIDLEQEIVSDKQLRKDLDEKLQVLKNLIPSRERSLAVTKIQEAIMWLGMDLKRLGTENPYPNSKDPNTGSVVEPTADGLKM